MNVWAGKLTFTTAQRISSCIERIIPQSCCIEPPRIIPTKKLLEDKKLRAVLLDSVAPLIFLEVLGSSIIGGRGFEMTLSLIFYAFIDLPDFLLLNML